MLHQMRLTIAYSKIKKAKSSVGYNKDTYQRETLWVTRSTALKGFIIASNYLWDMSFAAPKTLNLMFLKNIQTVPKLVKSS